MDQKKKLIKLSAVACLTAAIAKRKEKQKRALWMKKWLKRRTEKGNYGAKGQLRPMRSNHFV